MKIGIIQMHLYLPGCTSLKEKRGRIKPLISRLQKEFNVSVAELDLQDVWMESIIGCALLNNDSQLIQRSFEKITRYTQSFYTEIELLENQSEII